MSTNRGEYFEQADRVNSISELLHQHLRIAATFFVEF
jgi:hypothetical protein